MQNTVVVEIETLQAALREKVNSLRGATEEENKEGVLLKQMIDQLRDTLNDATQRVIQTVEEKLRWVLDPISHLKEQIEFIERRLAEKKEVWSDKGQVLMGEKIKEMTDLQEIEEDILRMKSNDIKVEDLIRFDSEEIERSILSALNIKDLEDSVEKEDYLLYERGRIHLKTGARENLKFDRDFPDCSARFQMQKKMYVCGGQITQKGRVSKLLSEFFSFNCRGESQELAPLSYSRSCVSLCGVPSELVAIGGYDNSKILGVCEIYSGVSNTWRNLPHLNTPRQWAASLHLKQNAIYCFCGVQDFRRKTYAPIERLYGNYESSEERWEVLSVLSGLPRTPQIAAVALKENIIVFGGPANGPKITCILNRDGLPLKDCSGDKEIPGDMARGSYLVESGKIYAVSVKLGWIFNRWELRSFNGKKWSKS